MSEINESETSTRDLLNHATEWLQYARGLTELLAELMHESDTVDCNRMATGLEAISALTRLGARCTAEAHVRLRGSGQSGPENRGHG